MQLNYKPASDGRLKCKSAIYHVESKYQEKELKSVFLSLKANVCDLNPALITKCITGTEQDFIMLMNRAGDYLARHHPDLSEDMRKTLMEMLSDAVFGYYVLTPLILSKEVSDIKVLAYDHIVVKANGQRYLTDVSFDSEEDYRTWYDRILRIHRLGKSEEYALNHCTDRKGVDAFYLRIDVQLSCIESVLVSQESDELYSNVHPQIQFEHTMTVRKNDVVTDFTLEDELRLGLLQDIDNFVIGEIKGGEALHVFTTAMSTGARFFGTIHSNDARTSVRRLVQCARYVSDYPMETLEEMLSAMPFVLIHMSRFSIDEIVEIEGWDAKAGKLIFHEVYRKEQGN